MEEKKQVRVWVDGCFDMMHYGHSNAIRKAKALGDYLIVGVHSDAEITKHKGPPVTKESERYAIVNACKWVDEVVENAPYNTALEILLKYNCDFCVHGDDIVTDCNGNDTYAEVKKAGKFKIIPRTIGVSTTDLVGRMLSAISTNDVVDEEEKGSTFYEDMSQGSQPLTSPKTTIRTINQTTKMVETIIDGKKPMKGDKIGYISGTFDVFHEGHVQILKKARENCDYLIVGLFPSSIVKQKKGKKWPIMSLKERGLTALACKYVDEIFLGVEWDLTESFINELNGHGAHLLTIFTGKSHDPAYSTDVNDGLDLAREKKMLVEIDSGSECQATTIIQRIMDNQAQYIERQNAKLAKEKRGFS